MYQIAKFDTHYVTADMRRKNIKTPSWFKCPTHTPEVVVLIHGHPDGLAHLGVWERLQCWAVRNWKTGGCFSTVNGEMSISDIALHTGMHGHEELIETAIGRLMELGWIISVPLDEQGKIVAGHGQDTGMRREEKKREEKKGGEKAESKSQHRRSRIKWTPEDGWTGITDDDRSTWRDAYVGVDIDRELSKMTAWLKANPNKANKRQWGRFITGWLNRSESPLPAPSGGGAAQKAGGGWADELAL